MDDLVSRLRGVYPVGVGAEFGFRSFAEFVPPINEEAAKRIELLESALMTALACIEIESAEELKAILDNEGEVT